MFLLQKKHLKREAAIIDLELLYFEAILIIQLTQKNWTTLNKWTKLKKTRYFNLTGGKTERCCPNVNVNSHVGKMTTQDRSEKKNWKAHYADVVEKHSGCPKKCC